MNLTITFPQLAAALAQATGSSQSTAETFIRQLFDYISSELSQGRSVSIKGLGAFTLGMSPENPILWQPAPELAEAVNQPFAFFEPVELNDGVTEEVLSTPPSADTDKKRMNRQMFRRLKPTTTRLYPSPNPTTLRLPPKQATTKSRPKLPLKNLPKSLKNKKSHRL